MVQMAEQVLPLLYLEQLQLMLAVVVAVLTHIPQALAV
jgi:hypothetical protein